MDFSYENGSESHITVRKTYYFLEYLTIREPRVAILVWLWIHGETCKNTVWGCRAPTRPAAVPLTWVTWQGSVRGYLGSRPPAFQSGAVLSSKRTGLPSNPHRSPSMSISPSKSTLDGGP